MEAFEGSESWGGFRFLGLAIAVFFALNITVFCAVSASRPLLNTLVLSPDRPSGIVTATFTHNDISHMFGNLAVFGILGLFFVGVNQSADLESRRRLSKIFVFGSFLAGMAASAVQLGIWKISGVSTIQACGASGMVYGAAGILLASALYNIPGCISNIRLIMSDRLGIAPPNIFYAISFSMCVVALFSYMAVFETKVFFYMESGVVWSAHELGFLFGFLASILVLLALRRRGRESLHI